MINNLKIYSPEIVRSLAFQKMFLQTDDTDCVPTITLTIGGAGVVGLISSELRTGGRGYIAGRTRTDKTMTSRDPSFQKIDKKQERESIHSFPRCDQEHSRDRNNKRALGIKWYLQEKENWLRLQNLWGWELKYREDLLRKANLLETCTGCSKCSDPRSQTFIIITLYFHVTKKRRLSYYKDYF